MYAVTADLLKLLGANSTQFVIPVYQRVYSWDERECRDLWKDVMRAGRNDQPHFIGSFLYTPEAASSATSMKRMLLIDGQQRMTTISLMLSAFLDWIEEDESRASFLTDVRPRALRKRYLFNDDDYLGEARYRLVLSQDDRETLHALVSGQPLPAARRGSSTTRGSSRSGYAPRASTPLPSGGASATSSSSTPSWTPQRTTHSSYSSR